MSRNREYTGQPHTDYGKRGTALIQGLTMRDMCDCYVRGVLLSASHLVPKLYEEALKGEEANLTPNNLYGFNIDKLDPMAVCQNMMCEVEKMMGIYPNIGALKVSEITVEDIEEVIDNVYDCDHNGVSYTPNWKQVAESIKEMIDKKMEVGE